MRLGEASAPEKVRRGTWILGLLAAAALAIFFGDEVQEELSEGPRLWISAEQTHGLAAGAPVWLAGHRVGRVTAVKLRPPRSSPEQRVLVRTVIREEAASKIRADASASLRPSGLMAPTVVSVRPGSPGAPRYDFSDTLEARPAVTAAGLRARAERAGRALDSLRRAEGRVLALADTGGGTVALLREDEELRRRLLRLREELARAAALVGRDSSTLARLARDPAALERLLGSLGAADSLGGRLTEEAGRWSGLAGRLSDLRRRAERLDALLGEARGSAGRLLHDDALARELGELRRRIREARAELLADPSRWLRLRLF